MKNVYFGLMMALFASIPAQAGVIAQDPLFISAQADPRVMLVASRDHQLFMKAYSDYSDLDGDGFLDTSFIPYIEYDGYFNPRKCYTYSTANNRFEAAAAATTGTVNVTFPDASTKNMTQYVCANNWSGNLLNWASMTRVDVLRKVFYGGYRSTDTESLTVLERAHLPQDVHAFAKVFDASTTINMNKFTPYSNVTAISFCNLTNDGASASKSSTNPPVMQIANGQYRLWAANEHPQCGTGGVKPAALRETLNARVKVCDDVGGTDTISGPGPKCKSYPKGLAKKPTGLLQQYGDADVALSLKFGLMTGSWAHGKSGGVLRKNIGSLSNSSGKYPNNYNCATAGEGFVTGSSDEIDFCTGVFVNNQRLARTATATVDDLPATGGIIGTFNRLRIAGWDGNKYDGVCNSPGMTSFDNGNCVDWGNPISEMYLETLRYIQAGNATNKLITDTSDAIPTAAFDGSDASFIAGLPQLTWKDPIPATEWCAKSNIVMLSTGLNSFDYDETAQSLVGWTKSTVALTNEVADSSHENISGALMIGSVTGASTYQSVCSPKTLVTLDTASGICPEVPSVEGSYHMAGLALGSSQFDLRPGYSAKRTKLWGANSNFAARQPLNTFTVALAENLPDFTINVGTEKIKFIPFCQANSTGGAALGGAGWRACSMVDLEVEPGTNKTAGSFKIMWEDSTWGNDYDMDGVVHIRYCVGAACNTYAGANGMPAMPATNTLYLKVASMTASAGHALKYGYTISGSAADGTVMNVLRPGGANLAAYAAGSEFVAPVASWTTPVWVAYSPSTSAANILKNPLWYTAKYAAWPTWDVKDNSTHLTKADGIPDNFFEVRNPVGLEQAISLALKGSLADPSSSSSIATNSTRLDTDTFVYQARFKATDWSGQVLAFPVDSNGNLKPLAWDASCRDLSVGECWDGVKSTKQPKTNSEKFPAEADRRIYTYNRSASPKGIDFKWASLSVKQMAGLDNTNASAVSSPVINYLRGDQSKELKDSDNDGVYDAGTIYRPRRTSLMGDIINSDPVFIGGQSFSYGNIAGITGYASYNAQVDKKLVALTGEAKKPMIVVNANDGMMHAIDARNGNEIFTYVPSWLICADETASTGCTSGVDSSPLRNLLDANMSHRYLLDGNLVVGDAYIDTGAGVAWKTVVVGAAAAGGKGLYALDVTKSYENGNATSASSTVAQTQTEFAALTASATVLWEFTDKDYLTGTPQNGDADLGYTYGQPVIGRMADGSWAAIFANGYGSSTGKAVLFIVNLADGTLIKKIEVGDGSNSTSPNGLSAPAAVFDAGTGAMSAIFAGDLKGNLWKFDVSSTNTNIWKVDNGSGSSTAPLFTAFDDSGNRQPITAALDIGSHALGGYMIYFGTGKYFEKNDNTSTTQQTIYGIWDKTSSTDEIAANTVDTAAKKDLVLQKHTILYQMANTLGAGGNIRITDDTGVITWSGTGAKRGWYLNVGTSSGERVVSQPILRNKRVIFTSMIPSASPCDFGGTSWIMEFDPESGNRPSYSIFDLNGDNNFSSLDFVTVMIGGVSVSVPVNGIQSTEGIIKSPAIISAGGKEYKIGSGTTGNVLVVSEQGSTTRPRPAWRQLQ